MKSYLAQQFIITLMAATMCLSSVAYANQTTRQIRSAVEDYVGQRLSSMANHPLFKGSSNIEIKVGRLDSRLKLARCANNDLMIQDHSGSLVGGRYLLKATCTGDNTWSLYVPVSISVIKPVVVATRAVPRGATLQADQLQLVDWEVNRLRYGYFGAIKQVLNRPLRKPLNAGIPVLPDHLGITQIVKKGDGVLIEASKGLVSVKSPGIALSGGGVGEQINVRNRRSKKIVRAVIVAHGLVSVPM